jgi:hypothetical protein
LVDAVVDRSAACRTWPGGRDGVLFEGLSLRTMAAAMPPARATPKRDRHSLHCAFPALNTELTNRRAMIAA